MSRRASIAGITGQDGSYLSELLLSQGYEVHGIIRRASAFNTSRIDHIYRDPCGTERCLQLHHGDLTGELEPTNRSYSVAKIAGIELCWS